MLEAPLPPLRPAGAPPAAAHMSGAFIAHRIVACSPPLLLCDAGQRSGYAAGCAVWGSGAVPCRVPAANWQQALLLQEPIDGSPAAPPARHQRGTPTCGCGWGCRGGALWRQWKVHKTGRRRTQLPRGHLPPAAVLGRRRLRPLAAAQHRGASGGRAGVQQLCCKQPAPNLRLIVPLPASASVPPASAPADAADAARRWAPAP